MAMNVCRMQGRLYMTSMARYLEMQQPSFAPRHNTWLLSVQASKSYLHSMENGTAIEAVAHSNTVLGAQLDTGSAVRDTQKQGPEDGYGIGYFYQARWSKWTYLVVDLWHG